jgi:hypothetical protein
VVASPYSFTLAVSRASKLFVAMAKDPERAETPPVPPFDAIAMEGLSTGPEKEETATQVRTRPEREPKPADYFVSPPPKSSPFGVRVLGTDCMLNGCW